MARKGVVLKREVNAMPNRVTGRSPSRQSDPILRSTMRGQLRRWGRRLVGGLLVFLVLLTGMLRPFTATAQEMNPQVLVLQSYHQGLSWADGLLRGIRDVFAENGLEPNIYVEYMDTKRFTPTETLYQQLYDIYQEKYGDVSLDVIVITDNNAFNFMLQYHDALFPGVPVVFAGINFFEDAMLAGVEDTFTGVVEDVDITDTLDVMLRLHPDTREIVVVNDATTTGQVYQDILRDVTPRYEDRVDFRYYENPDFAEMLPALRELPADTLVLLVLLNRDRDGQFYTYEESIDIIYENTDQPIYGLWDFYLGRGLVGGKLTNAVSQGRAAAERAVRILQGTPVSEIPVLKDSPNRYIFDYRQLSQFNIPVSELPEGSEVKFRPPTFYERYRQVIWPVAAVVGALGLIVVVQLVNIRRRQEVEADLRRSNQALEEARNTLEERVEQRTADLERRTWELETAAEVARDAAGLRDFDALLTTTVERISQRFGYYHAGIFLVDESGESAILRAASSEGGQQMLERGHKLPKGKGIVGSVLETERPRIALDVGEDVRWFDNPDLPKTRSEMALPLHVRGELLGVLDVQSEQPSAFTSEDVEVMQVLADQLGLALENARLLGESQRTIEELQAAYGEYARRTWLERRKSTALAYDGVSVRPVDAAEVPGVKEALQRGQVVMEQAPDGEGSTVTVPLFLRDQVIGVVALEEQSAVHEWSEDQIQAIQDLTNRIGQSLESARLLEETQSRARRERVIREISSQMRETLDVRTVLRTMTDELYEALDLEEVVVQLVSNTTVVDQDDTI